MPGSFLLFFTESAQGLSQPQRLWDCSLLTPSFCLELFLICWMAFSEVSQYQVYLPGIPLKLTKRERHFQKESFHPSYTSSLS